MKAVVKSIRISPKKLNLLAQLVRGHDAGKALRTLELTPKKGAKILHKAVKSAVANATNNFKQDAENLVIQEILVSKAPTFKRWLPASRGRMSPILKRNSHLTIKIGVKEEQETKKKPVTKDTKATAEKADVKKEKAVAPAKKSAPKSTKKVNA